MSTSASSAARPVAATNLLLVPEHLVAIGVALAWVAFATRNAGWFGFGAFAAFNLMLLLFSLATGGPFAWVISSVVQAFTWLIITLVHTESPIAISLTVWCAIAHHDLLRLGAARRRGARLPEAAIAGTVVAHGLLLLATLAVAVVLDTVAADPDDAALPTVGWGVVPVTFVVLGCLASTAVVVVARRPEPGDERRWRPGRRLLPPPPTAPVRRSRRSRR